MILNPAISEVLVFLSLFSLCHSSFPSLFLLAEGFSIRLSKLLFCSILQNFRQFCKRMWNYHFVYCVHHAGCHLLNCNFNNFSLACEISPATDLVKRWKKEVRIQFYQDFYKVSCNEMKRSYQFKNYIKKLKLSNDWNGAPLFLPFSVTKVADLNFLLPLLCNVLSILL